MSNPTELPDLDNLEADMRSNPAAAYAILDPKAVLQLIAAARRAKPEGEAPQAEPVAWRRATKHGWEYRSNAPTASTPGAGWMPLSPAATLSPLCGAQHAAAVAPSFEDCPEDDQQWAKVDPAVAFHLIERHAEDWADAGRLMLQWHNAMSRSAQLDGGQEGSGSNG